MHRLHHDCLGLNHLWARLLIEELVRCGVRQFCISPGGQSTPLVLAASEHPATMTIVQLDERSAAFFALGWGRGAGQPAALICTSGTALANYYPAVIEAYQSHTPLLLLTADLSGELTDSGVNQAIDQRRIFSDYLRWSFDFPAPDEQFSAPRLLSAVDQAVYRAARAPAGPVHLNCRFRKPLITPDTPYTVQLPDGLEAWQEGGRPYTTYLRADGESLGESELRRLKSLIMEAERGVIVVGEQPVAAEGAAIAQLAQTLGWPLLSEITSGLRLHPQHGNAAFSAFVTYLGNKAFREAARPDLVLHFGGDLVLHVQGAPVANCLNEYLSMVRGPYIMVHDSPGRQDPLARVTHRIEAAPGRVAAQLCEAVSARPSAVCARFNEMEHHAQEVQRSFFAERRELSELAAVRIVGEEITSESGLFLANSLPIRAADILIPQSDRAVKVASHHGVKGIDGTIAAAAGFAAGIAAPTTLIIGDVAFYHDLNSLLLLRKLTEPLIVVLLNNDGGNIFSYIPSSRTAQFEEYFLTPHGLQFEAAAAQFSIPYAQPQTAAAFREVYRAALRGSQSMLIEVCCPREQFIAELEDLFARVHAHALA